MFPFFSHSQFRSTTTKKKRQVPCAHFACVIFSLTKGYRKTRMKRTEKEREHSEFLPGEKRNQGRLKGIYHLSSSFRPPGVLWLKKELSVRDRLLEGGIFLFPFSSSRTEKKKWLYSTSLYAVGLKCNNNSFFHFYGGVPFFLIFFWMYTL